MTAPAETFTFGESDEPHRIADPGCDVGWCAGREGDFPRQCEEGDCVGLVHANFGDESWDDYWLYERCDACGGD